MNTVYALNYLGYALMFIIFGVPIYFMIREVLAGAWKELKDKSFGDAIESIVQNVLFFGFLIITLTTLVSFLILSLTFLIHYGN